MFSCFFAIAIWFLLKQFLSTITKTCCSALMPFFVISIISIRRYRTYLVFSLPCILWISVEKILLIHYSQKKEHLGRKVVSEEKKIENEYYLWPQAQNQTLNKTTTYHNTHRIHIQTSSYYAEFSIILPNIHIYV